MAPVILLPGLGTRSAEGWRPTSPSSGTVKPRCGPGLAAILALPKLAQRHVAYGVHAAHYRTVGVALLKTLAQGLGTAFTPHAQQAWAEVYRVMATIMISASQTAPASRQRVSLSGC
jgi:hypothetical protein